MSRFVRRPSPAIVVACLALAVTLTGTSAADILNVPQNSVGTSHLRANAVTSPKVKNGALLAIDLAPAARAALKGRTGPAGTPGPKGDKGDSGPPGIAGLEVVQAQSASDPSTPKTARAACPRGKRVLGGGGWAIHQQFGSETGPVALRASYPDGEGWRAWAVEIGAGFNGLWRVTAYAVCASVG